MTGWDVLRFAGEAFPVAEGLFAARQGEAAAGVALLGGMVCIGVLALAIYFIPFLLALVRGHPDTLAIFVLNILLGWTFVGWVLALVWSLTSKGRPPERY